MAGSSNRSPSPLPARHSPHPKTSSSEAHSAARRSFSGSPSPKPFPLTNPRRSFNPITPANSPADSGRRVLPVKEEIPSSWDYSEKENEKAAKLRSPAAKGSKNFMSPTISAASKFCPSPKKKVLVDRNEPVRSSVTLCDGKATFFSEIRPEKGILGIPDSKEDVLQGPPVTKSLRRVRFAEVPVNCDNVSDSLSETVLKHSDSKNINSCSTLSPSTTTIAPLDADPSLNPYDPKTNYLSPRPQFLHYRPKSPNPRIEVLRSMDKGVDMGEPRQLDESFVSEIASENSDSESQIEDSQKESEDSSSTEAEVEELEAEETEMVEKSKSLDGEVVLEPEIDETEVEEELDSELSLPVDEMAKEIPDIQKKRKLRFFFHSKLASSILLLVIACLTISVTDSPVLDGYGVKDLNLTNLSSLGSQISVLFHSTLNYQFKGGSDFSSLITDDLGPMQFIDLTADPKGGSKWELEEDREFKELEEDGEEEDVDSDVEGSEGVDDSFGDSREMEFGKKLEFEDEVEEDANELEFEDGVEEDVGSAEAEAIEGEVYTDFGDNKEMESESEENLVLEVEGGQNQKQELIASCYDSVNADDLVAAASQDFDIAMATDVQPEVEFQGDDNTNSHTQLETTLLDANIESQIDEKHSSSEMLVSPPIQIQERSFTMLLGISSFFLGAVAVFIFLKQKNVVTLDYVVPKSHLISASAKHIGQEKQSSEDWQTESCPSEMSTSYSRKDAMLQTIRAQRQDRKPSKSSNSRRESVAASSDYSLGSPSPSYGSFTTYERIPIKHGSGGGDEVMTPVRRSSRIRSQVTSPSTEV